MNIAAILNYLRPGEQWALSGNNYDALEWLSDTPKPTKQQLENEWPIVEAQLQRQLIESQRRAAYQTEADPLFFKWQRGEGTEQAWRDKVAEIRQRYPDPT